MHLYFLLKAMNILLTPKVLKIEKILTTEWAGAERYLGTIYRNILKTYGAVVLVAQLVERSLPTPVVRGSNPHIGGKNLY